MRPSPRASRTLALGLLALALVGASAGSVAAAPTLTLVPIGSDYQPDTLQLFANEASERSADNQVHILVLPDHVLAQRRLHDEERAQEEPDPRRQPPEPGRGGLQRRP